MVFSWKIDTGMSKDIISIIMLAHGRTQFVEESVRSVLAQSYSRWELLCVDDSPGYEVVRLLQDLRYGEEKIINLYSKNLIRLFV